MGIELRPARILTVFFPSSRPRLVRALPPLAMLALQLPGVPSRLSTKGPLRAARVDCGTILPFRPLEGTRRGSRAPHSQTLVASAKYAYTRLADFDNCCRRGPAVDFRAPKSRERGLPGLLRSRPRVLENRRWFRSHRDARSSRQTPTQTQHNPIPSHARGGRSPLGRSNRVFGGSS